MASALLAKPLLGLRSSSLATSSRRARAVVPVRAAQDKAQVRRGAQQRSLQQGCWRRRHRRHVCRAGQAGAWRRAVTLDTLLRRTEACVAQPMRSERPWQPQRRRRQITPTARGREAQ